MMVRMLNGKLPSSCTLARNRILRDTLDLLLTWCILPVMPPLPKKTNSPGMQDAGWLDDMQSNVHQNGWKRKIEIKGKLGRFLEKQLW